MGAGKLRVAVHKFSSCDGCQLAFLNLGNDLLLLTEKIDIIHFAEAGFLDEAAQVDVAFIEGSISTEDEEKRIQQIRQNSRYLITIGACATSGGIQALRNINNVQDWTNSEYASPEYISTLEHVSPVSEKVRVDFELWGCPISREQIVATVTSLLQGVTPKDTTEKVCMECKRQQVVCKLVTSAEPCLGPVTKAGCGAICPEFGRGCYACYGPAKDSNTQALINRFAGFGLSPGTIANRFSLFHNNAPTFKIASESLKQKSAGNNP